MCVELAKDHDREYIHVRLLALSNTVYKCLAVHIPTCAVYYIRLNMYQNDVGADIHGNPLPGSSTFITLLWIPCQKAQGIGYFFHDNGGPAVVSALQCLHPHIYFELINSLFREKRHGRMTALLRNAFFYGILRPGRTRRFHALYCQLMKSANK